MPMAQARGTHKGQAASSGGRRWAALIVLCVGQLMIVLDTTVVNVALPTIQRELHFSQASLAWVVNAYLLTFGGLILLAGRVGDLLGRTRLFLGGLGAFSLASMLCGLAPSAPFLVAARFVQGATAAMVAAMVLGIISPMFPEPREHTIALSIFSFVAIGGVSLGLVVGGSIIQVLSWHWIFFINVPVGLVALVAGRRLIEQQPGLGLAQGADLLGAVLVTAAPALAVYGMVNAGNTSWGSVSTVTALVGAAALAVLFVVVESRVPTPLIPLRILRNRTLASASLVRILIPVGGFGLNFLGALYFQHVLGYSPLRTGLAFLPNSAVTGFMTLLITPRLASWVSLKALTVSGLVFMIASLTSLARISVHSSYVEDVLPAMLLMGIGIGLLFMPTVSIVMSSVAPSDAGVASGVANIAVQFGASLGVAALATVSASHTASLLAGHESLPAALTDGYRLGFLVAAGCACLSLIAALLLLSPGRPRTAPEEVSLGPAPAVPDGSVG
jgi:EmrB/QacA subfamily drug resistance transporter